LEDLGATIGANPTIEFAAAGAHLPEANSSALVIQKARSDTSRRVTMNSSALILDGRYSRSFLYSAARSGLVKLTESFPTFEKSSAELIKHFLDESSTRSLRRATLEMAVLFDTLHICGVPGVLDTSRLKSAGIVGFEIGTGQTLPQYSQVPVEFVIWSMYCIAPRIRRQVNSTFHGLFGTSVVGNETVKTALRETVRMWGRVGGVLDINKLGETLSDAITDSTDRSKLAYFNELTEAAVKIARATGLHPKDVYMLLRATIGELTEYWTANLLGCSTLCPLLTTSPTLAAEQDSPSSMVDAFKLCRITMRDELGYAPVVDSLEDVLRLRDNSHILRFREVLSRWCCALQLGEEHALKEIRDDVRKSNHELRKLERWKRIDNLFFWTSLPVSLIPIVSAVASVASFGVGLWTRRVEKAHSWLLIAR
jgi:hypothetical protein